MVCVAFILLIILCMSHYFEYSDLSLSIFPLPEILGFSYPCLFLSAGSYSRRLFPYNLELKFWIVTSYLGAAGT